MTSTSKTDFKKISYTYKLESFSHTAGLDTCACLEIADMKTRLEADHQNAKINTELVYW